MIYPSSSSSIAAPASVSVWLSALTPVHVSTNPGMLKLVMLKLVLPRLNVTIGWNIYATAVRWTDYLIINNSKFARWSRCVCLNHQSRLSSIIREKRRQKATSLEHRHIRFPDSQTVIFLQEFQDLKCLFGAYSSVKVGGLQAGELLDVIIKKNWGGRRTLISGYLDLQSPQKLKAMPAKM